MMMQERLPASLLDRMRAPLTSFQSFMPALRAYSGFSLREAAHRNRTTLGRLGSLEVRLAQTAAEVRRAQRLRYRVFYGEMSASADAKTKIAQRDIDTFDAYCDHLLVLDHATLGRT